MLKRLTIPLKIHHTPLTSIKKLVSNPEPKENTNPDLVQNYQSAISSLMYIMLGTCPDLNFTVGKLASFLSNPSPNHQRTISHVFSLGQGALTQQAHGEFMVSSETKCLPNTQQVHGRYFLKVLTMDLLGIGQALCFRTHNELTMGLLGKCTLAPSVWQNVKQAMLRLKSYSCRL